MAFVFSIRTKLFLIILGPAVLLLFVVYSDYRNLDALGRSAELIMSNNYRSIKIAQEIRHLLEDNQDRILRRVFSGEKTLDAPDLDRKLSGLIQALQANITETGEGRIIESIFERYNVYRQIVKSMPDEVMAANDTSWNPIRIIEAHGMLVGSLNDLVIINERAMEQAEQRTRLLANRTMRYSMGLLIAAFFCSLLLSLIFSVQISKPLRRLAGTLAGIKEGSGNYPTLPPGSRDEIGFLNAEFNRLFRRIEAFDRLSADKLWTERLKVRQSDEAKARFIADLSHQLKTPMTSLSMSIGMLAEQPEDLAEDTKQKLISTAFEDCGRLSALIHELVDIARLEGMVEPRVKELLDMEVVVRECLKPLLNQADSKRVRLLAEVERGLPRVAIDSLRFPWIITNLAGNAIRYTPSGGKVVIRVNQAHNRLIFQCEDTGSGIEKKFLPLIFERFTQFSARETSGTIGLGLAIVREIIEQHGGRITVDSEVGQGTIFTFWIPLNLGEQHA